MKIAFNPSTVAALITPPNNKDITFDLRGRNIFARGVKFQGTDTWRDIKINNVSIGSNILDLRNGSNTTLTNTNGVVTINSTWRPVVDNLTSDSTTNSLSAKQGKVLKSLIDGKSNSGHTHDDRYLKLTGGTMASNALITFADSGSWGTDKGPQGARGGLYWTGQSDYAKLYAEETAGDNLDLVIQFGDDNSNGLSIRNKANTQTSYISAGGVITTGTFKGNLDWSYITNKPSSYTPSAHTHAWNSLTHSSTTENQAILTNGKANGWKLQTLNIARWDNAANNTHSHSNKSVLDGITSALVNNWNIAYNFVSNITGTDTDKVINKWEEIVNFLAGITEDNKLNTLLNSKLSIQQLSAKDILTTKTNNALFWVDTKGNASTITTGPFTDRPYALLSVTNYNQNAENHKFFYRSRLAFSSAGDIKVASCHHENEYKQDETWYNVLTSKNSGISGSTIKLNGTSITVYSSSTTDGRYVKKSGDTMSGVLTIDTTNFGALVIKRNDDANGASIQFRGKSNVYGYIGLNSASKDKQFLRWNSDTSKTYTILDTSSTYVSSGKGVINSTTITQVDNATNSTNSTNARKLVNWYSARPTSLNTQFGDGSLRIFYATSSTTEGKSPDDATVLHLAWDNNGGWDSQLAINSPSSRVYSRSQNSGTWQPWKTLAFTTDIPSSLKNPYSLTTFGVVYDGSAAKTVTTSNFISQVTEGISTITDGTMFITSYASNSGFADTNAVNVPYKRKAIHLWEYVKAKTDSLYATKSHNHDDRYVRAFGTSNDNIDSDWGQSFKTFDPIPSGTPPEQNPNISLLSIGNSFNRRKQLAFIYSNDNIYYRRHVDGGFTNWRRLAFANEIPTSLKNPHALTISLNGTSQGPYDGSAAKNINITPGSIGAATSGHTHDGRYLRWNGSTADISAMGWGTLTAANGYTILSHAASSDGGDMGFVNKGGQIFMQLDGYYYQKEGKYRVLDTSDFTTFSNIGSQTTRITIGGITKDLKIDADLLDGWHLDSIRKNVGYSWSAKYRINNWSRIIKINNYSNILLAINFSQNSQASNHLYLISTGYGCGNIVQLGANGFNSNSAIKIRLTENTATSHNVEIYSTYGYNGATELSINCNYTRIDGNSTITTYSTYTAGEGTVRKEITSSYSKIVANLQGNSDTTTKLQTPRQINGTNFDGSANITTSYWGTTRTLTIGNSGKSVNGSANISWSLSEIGAAPSSHSHNYAANENYGGFTKSGRLPISGFYQSAESESGGNAPWSSWMHLINCQHNNTGNNYALQIAASFYDNNTFKIRITNNNVNNAWRDIIHSGNIGSQTVANAYHLRINSANTWSTWYWSGQSGQPSWLWGSNDGTNMYVWNPSNFRVAYASSAGNADTVDGYHVAAFNDKPWGYIPAINLHGYMDIGKHLEFHYDNTTGSDYSTILRCTGNYANTVNLPSESGTLALTKDVLTFSNDIADYLDASFNNSDFSKKAASKYIQCYDSAGGWWNWMAGKFMKAGSSDAYVLLGGGGHKLESSLRVAYASNADMVDGYHIDDILPYGLENLCIGVVQTGNNTTLNADGSITTSGINGDTYFFVRCTENLTAGQIYTFGFYVTGVQSENTSEWWFSFDNNVNNLTIKIKSNGWCWGTGTINHDIAAGKIILIDDSIRGFYNSINISKFVIVKGKQKAYYTPPISKMSVNYATSSGNADTVDGQHFSYLNSSNSPTYLWATNSDGSSFLAARASISVNYANSAGNATTATKLTSSAGSATLPIYFSDGKPVACTASSVFSNLSNSGNNLSITVAGQNRTLTVGYATSAGSATKVIVNQNTTNDTNYPLVWSNQNNSNTVTENQLYKSWSDLYYNPKNKRLTVGGSVVASSFVKSGGTSQQLLRTDGGIAAFNWSGQSGQPTWLWGGNNEHSYYVYNPSNFRVAYATSSGNADTLDGVHLSGIFTAFGNNGHNITATIGGTTKSFLVNWAADSDKLDGYHASNLLTSVTNTNNGISVTVGGTTKSVSNISVNYANSAGNADTAQYLRSLGNQNCQTGRTQNYGDVYTYNTYDGNTGSPTTFTSVIGFGRGIAGTVEIAGGWDNTNLYWRSLRDCCEDWHSWRTVLDSSNYTEFINNYYWANVKISTSASTTTSPTVSNLTATSSIKMGNIYLQNTNEINSASGIHLNYQNSGNISLCVGGGNVGIGAISPSYKLNVNGNIHSSGTINCNALNVSTINCNALNVGSTLSIKDSVISCSASNISIESKESGSLLINSREVLRYDSDFIYMNNRTNFLHGLCLKSSILGTTYSTYTTDNETVLIGVLRDSSSFKFRPAKDGQLLFLKIGKLYSDTYFWCTAENCVVVRAKDFGIYLDKNQNKDCFGDGQARIFIYIEQSNRWYEFYCG